MSAPMIASILVQWGIPTTVGAATLKFVDAIIKRRQVKRAAPQTAIDTSIARAQQIAVMQDNLNTNLQDENKRLSAELAAERDARARDQRRHADEINRLERQHEALLRDLAVTRAKYTNPDDTTET